VGTGEANETLAAALAIASTPGIGAIRFRRLVDRFGDAPSVLHAGVAGWSAALDLSMDEAGRLVGIATGAAAREEARTVIERSVREGVWALPLGDPGYPPLLARTPDPPPVLFGRGQCPEPERPAIAVVGSRRASAYGIRQAASFAGMLASRGLPVISGGARGIDAEAHRAALRVVGLAGAGPPGVTVAVLGSGHARPYPPEHRELFAAIVAAGGAVVSEHPPWVEARPEFFPRRNRIVSGLSVGVLVVEAGARSGAGITARLAVEDQNRMAWAIPGRIGDRGSEGTLRAIREGWVACVTGPEDLLEDLGFAAPLLRGAGVERPHAVGQDRTPAHGDPPLGVHEATLLARLREEGEIALEAIDSSGDGTAVAALTVLEMLGLVRNREGVVFPS
jgi:DNA processing protein